MIPLKLHIKNFLSYGSDIQTIDFEPYHLICLSGKNGHGKSALLDAITWATWGQARKLSGVAKADQGLLRLGQTQMMVSLDFIFDNQQYRVKREFMQTYGKPVASLEFGMLDVEHDRYIPLTGKTIRETQATIEKTINLDYESFINSAFLRQGQSNEFSKKSAKERKEVFATILGLNQYELIKKRAAEKIRFATQQKTTLSALIDTWTEKLKSRDEVVLQLQDIEGKLALIKTQETVLEAAQQTLATKKKKFATEKQQYEQLQTQHARAISDEEKKLNDMRTVWHLWRTAHKILIQAHQLPELEAQKKVLAEQLTSAQTMLQKQLEIKEQYIKEKELIQRLEQSIQEKELKAQHAHTNAQEQLTFTIKHLQTELATHKTELEKKQQEIGKLIQQEEHLQATLLKKQTACADQENIEKQFDKRKAHYHQWIAQGNMLSAELTQLQQKNALVSDDAPSCPLCEQNLSASRRRFLKKQFADDELFIKHRITRLSSLIKQLKEVLLTQHTQLEAYRTQAQEAAALKAQIQALMHHKQELQNHTVHLVEKIQTHEKMLSNNLIDLEKLQNTTLTKPQTPEHEEVQAHKLSLEVLEQALAAIKQDPTHVTHLHAQLQKVDQEIQKFNTVIQQRAVQEQRQNAITELIREIKVLRALKATIAEQMATQTSLATRETEIIQEEEKIKYEASIITKQKEHLLHEKGGGENQLKELAHLAQQCEQQHAQIKIIDTGIADYQAIAQATGKEGIQALLIEDAIPEVEQEANSLLAKLTDNQTQLFIESLRDLKKGGTKETLDIKISDAVGIRPYELFSGGEAFRIDFALRIAISKLLARRAGASLQTLIIDEGFGSQDEEGLSHIMDALYKIQDDFAKIIIVSHLSSMKDQFPVHFVIEKGAQGSSVHVMEHD